MSVKAGWRRGGFLTGFSGLESQLGKVKEGYRLGILDIGVHGEGDGGKSIRRPSQPTGGTAF
jgi:hypothetical protein